MRKVRRIDLEAHFYTEAYLGALASNKGFPRLDENEEKRGGQFWFTEDTGQPFTGLLLERLLDFSEERLKIMDEHDIDMQVLSLSSPGLEQLDPSVGTPLSRQTNDYLAQVIRRHPGKFMGFAALAPKEPEAAAAELERAVKELGFKGWNTHSNYGDSYLDEPQYRPVFAMAEALNVPVYLHPTVSAIPQVRKYGFALAGAPFGYGFDVALCLMRLIISGIFDAYPGLKIILGHLGEGLPFLMERMDGPANKRKKGSGLNLARKLSDYLRHNVCVTTSGNAFKPAFTCTREALGIEKILFATDYPYEDPGEAVRFLDGLPLTEQEREMIYSRNAEGMGFC